MLRIVILIICAICGFLFGMFFKRRALNRNFFWTDLTRYIAQFQINMNGRQMEVMKLNEEFTANCSSVFAGYLSDRKTACYMTKRERTEVDQFFNGLNAVSSDELKNHLEYHAYIFSEECKVVSDQMKKSAVYPKLGALLGVMVGIVLI